jgi:hypothetical protein
MYACKTVSELATAVKAGLRPRAVTAVLVTEVPMAMKASERAVIADTVSLRAVLM